MASRWTRRARLFGLSLLGALATPPALAWDVRISGTGSGLDEARAVAIDANGDVIAAGVLYDATRFHDFVVVKRSGVTGGPLWQRAAWGNGGAACCGTDESAHAVAVDAAGIVFAAGHLEYDPPPTGRSEDFAVIRYQPGGELWRSLIDGGQSGALSRTSDLARDVAVAPDGSVVAAGYLTIFALLPEGRTSEFAVTRLAAASGAPIWTRRIRGTDGSSTDANSAHAVAVDAGGDVIAVGSLFNAVGREFVVMKLASATGEELWRRELGAGTATSVVLDAGGNAIAAGQRAGAYAVKLDAATGETLWEHELEDGIWNRVALDAQGNAIAAGELPDVGGMRVLKHSAADGSELWPPFALSGTNGSGSARGVGVDPAGDVLVGGFLWNTSTHYDFSVLKLSAASGAELWRREIDGGLAGQDEVRAIAVDGEGHVVAVGRVDSDPVGRIHFAIIKLRGRDGADLAPCGDVDGDYDVDTSDLARLRSALAGAPPGIASPERCSVYGGAHDCDLVDRVVFFRWFLSQNPRVASVCAAVVE
jgi:uncharacterized delta-60 repeat protein